MDRDKYCLHCGETEAVSPNHRINRGMGGSKALDYPENLVILCSRLNLLIESDPEASRQAKAAGWKLERWENPREKPVFDALKGQWQLLTKDYKKITL